MRGVDDCARRIQVCHERGSCRSRLNLTVGEWLAGPCSWSLFVAVLFECATCRSALVTGQLCLG
jgi:hypothetical protein